MISELECSKDSPDFKFLLISLCTQFGLISVFPEYWNLATFSVQSVTRHVGDVLFRDFVVELKHEAGKQKTSTYKTGETARTDLPACLPPLPTAVFAFVLEKEEWGLMICMPPCFEMSALEALSVPPRMRLLPVRELRL